MVLELAICVIAWVYLRCHRSPLPLGQTGGHIFVDMYRIRIRCKVDRVQRSTTIIVTREDDHSLPRAIARTASHLSLNWDHGWQQLHVRLRDMLYQIQWACTTSKQPALEALWQLQWRHRFPKTEHLDKTPNPNSTIQLLRYWNRLENLHKLLIRSPKADQDAKAP